jgi:putative Mg2+ transporter-C (MgtC) family protein
MTDMTLTWIDFSFRLLTGFILGVGIGIERQWLKTRAVLKTNVLVTLGAAMFVMLSIMTPGDASPTRISAQVVSGIGFLGGGVILREGGGVRGINTAATLWCAAAVGTLVGSGHLVQAYLGTLAVVGANLLLRPLESAFKQQRDLQDKSINSGTVRVPKDKPVRSELSNSEVESQKRSQQIEMNTGLVVFSTIENRYCCHVLCTAEDEVKVLALLLKFARERQWTLTSLRSKNLEGKDQQDMAEVEINVDFTSPDISYELKDLEEVVSLIKSKAKVNSVNWQFYRQDISNF